MQKINAQRKYTITTNGLTLEQFVEQANRLHWRQFGEELESMDGGDATGAIIRLLNLEEEGTFAWVSDDGSQSITAIFEDDLFVWEPPVQPEEAPAG